MEIILNPARSEWQKLTVRNIPDESAVDASVRAIVEDVRNNGDEALLRLTEKFDGVRPESLTLTASRIEETASRADSAVVAAMQVAKTNIEAFHRAQLPVEVEVDTMPGIRCVQRPVPIQRVGIYIPGGRAPLFSTVLMLAVPAKIAGCREVALFTPAGRDGINPHILAAAKLCGITEVHPLGGAQAIAAMAFGTESVKRVDKVFGPGNRYVTKAKQIVSAAVAIDMPAGPSEVMVVADDTANPAYCAADMLSQAEHGPDSQAILVCASADFAQRVAAEVDAQSCLLTRRESVEGSLSHSRIIVLNNRDDMIAFANTYGAEHLILSLDDPWQAAAAITAAGSIFIGNHSPESAGDYASGTNHTLPTAGWAASMSGVNTDSFIHKITIQQLTPAGLAAIAPTVTAMAHAEGLEAHANAVKIRLQP